MRREVSRKVQLSVAILADDKMEDASLALAEETPSTIISVQRISNQAGLYYKCSEQVVGDLHSPLATIITGAG